MANLFLLSFKAALGEAILGESHGLGMGNGGFEMDYSDWGQIPKTNSWGWTPGQTLGTKSEMNLGDKLQSSDQS